MDVYYSSYTFRHLFQNLELCTLFLETYNIDRSFISPIAEKDTDDVAIKMQNGTFYWKDEEEDEKWRLEKERIENRDSEAKKSEKEFDNPRKIVLEDINLEVKKGKLVAVIGEIGAGKSSLLSSMLGDLHFVGDTKLSILESQAYVGQNPWLQSESIRDNITFGLEFDSKKYSQVLKVSGLEDDLKIIKDGDKAMLGEKGINLSGGQRVRVAIARAFYA